jgi:hypothetical protein
LENDPVSCVPSYDSNQSPSQNCPSISEKSVHFSSPPVSIKVDNTPLSPPFTVSADIEDTVLIISDDPICSMDPIESINVTRSESSDHGNTSDSFCTVAVTDIDTKNTAHMLPSTTDPPIRINTTLTASTESIDLTCYKASDHDNSIGPSTMELTKVECSDVNNSMTSSSDDSYFEDLIFVSTKSKMDTTYFPMEDSCSPMDIEMCSPISNPDAPFGSGTYVYVYIHMNIYIYVYTHRNMYECIHLYSLLCIRK